MVDRATYVELVRAEAREPINLEALFASQLSGADDRMRAIHLEQIESIRPFAATVTFRVVETLKGPGVETFRMDAFVGDGSDLVSRRRWARERRDFRDPADYWFSDTRRPFEEAFPFGTCLEPPVAVVGASYLIFRNEMGQILDAEIPFAWRHSDAHFTLMGPNFEEVFEANDPWVRRVRREVSRTVNPG